MGTHHDDGNPVGVSPFSSLPHEGQQGTPLKRRRRPRTLTDLRGSWDEWDITAGRRWPRHRHWTAVRKDGSGETVTALSADDLHHELLKRWISATARRRHAELAAEADGELPR